jgi:diaphanous 1
MGRGSTGGDRRRSDCVFELMLYFYLMFHAGIIRSSTPVAPLLNTAPASPTRPSMGRHFSAFPLTSHLHKPVLRLVSLHPLLSLTVSFLRVPQIHDGYEWSFFISRGTTVEVAVGLVVDELGLSRNLPVAGGGNFEYVLEEVWTYERAEGGIPF